MECEAHTMKLENRTLCVLSISLAALVCADSSLAGPRGLLRRIFKKPAAAPAIPTPAPRSTSNSTTDKQAEGVLGRFEQKPHTVEIPDEVSFGDTVTAKVFALYGADVLDQKKYAPLWDYCNLIAHALAQVNILRPRLRFDSDYEAPIPADLPDEDRVLLENIGWHVGIIDSDEVGGCSAPGGYILITKGLIKACRSEAELAGVIAHEMAHVSRSHGLYVIFRGMRERRQQKEGLQIVAAVVRSKSDRPIGQAVANVFQRAAYGIEKYSTFEYGADKETEADEIGAELMYRLGYNPEALISFLQRLDQSKNKAYGTHPPAEQRAKDLMKYILAKCPGARELKDNTERFERYVKNLP